MRKLLGGVIAAVFALAACNMTIGECWIDGQDGQGSGAGGGILVPGQGGYGDVPPKPQGAGEPQPPDCNIVADTACNEKCLEDYQNAAAVCGKLANESDRLTCQHAAYVGYTTCRATCLQQQNDCLEHCKDLCYTLWEKCQDDCPKGDGNCRSECTNKLAACNRECDKKCGPP